MSAGTLTGILGGFLAMVALVFLLPRGWGHLRPVAAALAGGVVAYLLMNYVK